LPRLAAPCASLTPRRRPGAPGQVCPHPCPAASSASAVALAWAC
jgi:hypothetical protein